MSSSASSGPSAITSHLRNAVETADWQSLTEFLDPNVTWGEPEGGVGCRGRSSVLSRWECLHADGLCVTVDEIFTYPAAVVLGLSTQHTAPAPGPPSVMYQVYDVTGGLITRITGYSDRSQALDAACAGTSAGF